MDYANGSHHSLYTLRRYRAEPYDGNELTRRPGCGEDRGRESHRPRSLPDSRGLTRLKGARSTAGPGRAYDHAHSRGRRSRERTALAASANKPASRVASV